MNERMEMTLSQKILAGFIACAVALLAVAIFSFRNSQQYMSTNHLVDHTYEVLNEFHQITTASSDGESSVRGYIISGNEIFLQPYFNSRKEINDHLARLKNLTEDNPVQ